MRGVRRRDEVGDLGGVQPARGGWKLPTTHLQSSLASDGTEHSERSRTSGSSVDVAANLTRLPGLVTSANKAALRGWIVLSPWMETMQLCMSRPVQPCLPQ